jgi:hypothetical protein
MAFGISFMELEGFAPLQDIYLIVKRENKLVQESLRDKERQEKEITQRTKITIDFGSINQTMLRLWLLLLLLTARDL